MTKQLLLRLSVVAVLFFWALDAGAQNKGTVVTGEVFNSDSEPMVGVTVVEKGKPGGTSTNIKGKFTFKVSDPNAVLVFSYIGMESKEEKLNGRTNLKITLYEDANMLEEVVVSIGYGTARKSDLTGSVSSVSEKAFSEKHITNMEDALRGRVAGVRILSESGEPGESLNIRIRGAGSLNAGNSPIYVIDGIVSETSDVSPGDIQSIEILKDASATAIYGSRGSNGVVIITTKRGSAGGAKVSFTFSETVQHAANKLDMMETGQFADAMRWGAYSFYPKDSDSKNFGTAQNVAYTDSEGNYYVLNTANKWTSSVYRDPSDPNYVNTDWQSEMMRTVIIQDYRINVTGGDKKTKYAAMAGYYNMPGILVHSGFEKYSLRANFESSLGKRGAVFGLNLSGFNSVQNGLATDGSGTTLSMLIQAPTKRPTADDLDAEPGEAVSDNNNPLYQAKRIKKRTEKTNVNLRLYFNIPITKAVMLKLAGNFYNNQNHNENFYPKDVAQGRTEKGKATNVMNKSLNWTSENLITWNPKIKNTAHKFDLMAGIIVEQRSQKILSTEVRGIDREWPNTAAMQNAATFYNISTTYTKTRMLSYLGRANYTYKNLYFTGTIRFDGSSKFGRENKWGVFPSGAVMWRMSEESFLKPADWLNSLKLRGSVGATGNENIPTGQSLSLLTSQPYPVNGTSSSPGFITQRPANPYLKWESNVQYDAALEFSVLDYRIGGTFEVYYKKTTDLLFEQPQLYTSGYSSQWSNVASVANKGLEISLNALAVKGNKFSWTIDYNMAFNKSKVLSLGGASELILSPGSASRCTDFGILRVGKPLGNWYGYQSDGVWTRYSDIAALPEGYQSAGKAKAAMRPGATKLVDQNNDGTVNTEDRVILGNSEPKFTGGLGSSMKYGNFTLSFGFEFSYGGQIFNATARELMQLNSGSQRNSLVAAGNYWTPRLFDMDGNLAYAGNEGSDLKMPMSGWENFLSDRFLEDASYLRLDNISLNYTLPTALVKKMRLSKLSLFFSVRNAFVITGYSGYDPDVSMGKGIYADLLPKLDAASFPRSRSYTIGATLEF